MVNILEVDSVQKSYNNRLVVSDVYLKCQTGNIIGLFGRNGSGKSTLLKMIFGIVPGDKFIRINGVKKESNAELLQEISYLGQDNFIPSWLSVKNAIALSVPSLDLDAFYGDKMIESIRHKKISHLSGGELRYLEIKLILSNSSKFALLDEPYNGLSPIMVDIINDLIRSQSSSKGIIITDHNYKSVLETATQIILMHDGKTHHLDDKNELIEKGYLGAGTF